MKAFILKNWFVVIIAVAAVAMAGPSVAKYAAQMQSHHDCPNCGSYRTSTNVRPEFYEGHLMCWTSYITCIECGVKSTSSAQPPENADELIQAALAKQK
jgi:hypothetical protein